jgi:hypothetical protein
MPRAILSLYGFLRTASLSRAVGVSKLDDLTWAMVSPKMSERMEWTAVVRHRLKWA